MEKLVKFIISSIVDKPKEVEIKIEKALGLGYAKINLKVANEDMGKVIGKRGKIIKAIRDLVKVKSILLNQKFFLSLQES